MKHPTILNICHRNSETCCLLRGWGQWKEEREGEKTGGWHSSSGDGNSLLCGRHWFMLPTRVTHTHMQTHVCTCIHSKEEERIKPPSNTRRVWEARWGFWLTTVQAITTPRAMFPESASCRCITALCIGIIFYFLNSNWAESMGGSTHTASSPRSIFRACSGVVCDVYVMMHWTAIAMAFWSLSGKIRNDGGVCLWLCKALSLRRPRSLSTVKW